jgi:hypothetical protein
MNLKTKKEIKSVLKTSFPDMGWGICIGAGTSFPVFPTWNNLVESLIRRDKSIKDANAVSKSLLKRFSPDSLIQAVQNKLDKEDSEFAKMLSEELYENLKTLSGNKWDSIKTIFESMNPHLEKDPVWRDYIEIREKHFKKTSAYTLGKFIHETIEKGVPPDVIISFNAESLLFSLVNSFEREKYLGKVKKTGQMIAYLDRLTHSISSHKKKRTKYVFCHGLLLAPLSKKRSPLLTASDKLVFSESSYLNLANTNFSWQSTEFISYCLNHTIIFIGVSLTDPNMRRWLSWIQKLKETEVLENNILPKEVLKQSYSHYWINKKPDNIEEIEWIEACVKHLGIKIIWLDKWEDLHQTLKLMIE